MWPFKLGLAIVFALLSSLPHTHAQDPFAKDPDDEKNRVDAFAPLDYSRRSKLDRAEELLRDENYDDALPILASLLGDDAEDYFLNPNGGTSLKQHIHAKLAALPAKGFDTWEAFFGATAQRSLAEGLSAGDPTKIEEVVRRYPFTSSASTAAMLLGRRAFDSGNAHSAASYFALVKQSAGAASYEPALSLALALSWSRAGDDTKSLEALVDLKKRYDRPISLQGQAVTLPTQADEVKSWLTRYFGSQQSTLPRADGWAVFRGNASRNSIGSGSAPLARRRWRAATYVDPAEEAELLRLYRQNIAQGRAALPTAVPVVASYLDAKGNAADAVIVRSLRHLLAVDFATGRVLWQTETASPDATTKVDPGALDDLEATPTQRLASDDGLALLAQRMWDDVPYGQISTDSARVYTVDDLGLSRGTAIAAGSPFNMRRRVIAADGDETLVNRLVARELASQGKIAWQVGGTESRREPKLAGAFFLGSPLPVDGVLYAIAEIKREVRLVALEATSGKLLWQQQLVPALRGVGLDNFRRRYGATPAMAQGVLVCPTSAGAIVAVDVANRSLLWGVYYGKSPQGQITPWGFQELYDRDDSARRQRWADATVIIEGDRVLVAPVDGDEGSNLYCHDLRSGRKVWEKTFSRRENLFVAGIRSGKAIIVGSDRLQSLHMEDGVVDWASDEFGLSATGERCLPTGRGFAGDKQYYLPVSSGELIGVELATGKISERRPIGREPLGNLICYRGELVSYGVTGLAALWQTDSLERRVEDLLTKNPADAWALARRGELLLDSAKFDDAVATFRQAIEKTSDAANRRHTSQLLAETLLDKLQADFVAHRGSLDEVDRLVGTGRLRDRFERVAAAGLQQAGDRRAAFARYMKLIESNGVWDEMIEPDTHRRVRRDAWMRAQLAALLAAATPEELIEFDVTIRAHVDAALKTGQLSAVRTTVAYFAGHPASAAARLKLAAVFAERDDLLAAEQQVLSLASASEPPIAGRALAMLGELYLRTNRHALAASHARRLEGEFRDVRLAEIRQGEAATGHDAAAAILTQLALRDPTASILSPADASHRSFPTGFIKAELGKRTGNPQPGRETQYGIPVVGPRGLAIGDGQLILERNAHRLMVRNDLGGEALQVSLASGPPTEERELDPYVCAARERGHLVILSAGDRIVALSGFGPANSTQANNPFSAIAWEQPLANESEEPTEQVGRYGQRRRVDRGQITKRWGEVSYRAIDSDANVQGVLGPITAAGVSYQRGRELTCVEPATGKVLWSVDNLPAGCELFGDDELLFAAPHDDLDGAFVFRAADGQPLGKRPVPSEMSRMATLGRNVLVWGQYEGKLQISLLDCWTGKRTWSREVGEGTVAQVLRDRVAVFEPSGKFAMVDIASGHAAFEQQLLSEFDEAGQPRLTSLHVLASTEHVIVIANRNKAPDHTKDNKLRWVTRQTPLVTGRVYALNPTTGAMQWPVPAEIADQGFVTTQPVGLPLVAFMRHVSQGDARDPRTPFTTHLYCLDKRTGGAVMYTDPTTKFTFSRLDLESASAYGSHWTADPVQGTAVCTLPALAVTFRLTNQPLPPEPPAQLADRDPDGDAARQARAIGSFFKDLGRGYSEPPTRNAFRPEEDDIEDE